MSWETFQLKDLTEPERPITYGVVKPGPEDDDQGVRFVRGGDICDGKIAIGQLRTITSAVSKPYARTILRGGELLISLVGNPGEVAIAPLELAGANIARQAGLIALRSEINSKFVMYFLRSPKGRAELFQRTQGAVQQVINLADLRTVKISMPDQSTQQRIAGILSAYDDLIENNRRRIGLLEQAARLLYREWFVHLRFPGHETAKIVDGLPEGWVRAPISTLFDTSSGSTPSRKNDAFFGGQINWLKTQELQNCFIFDTDEKITEEGLKRSSAKMFPENTVIIAMYGATIGQLAILAKPSSTNQACCALLPKRNPLDYLFGYCLMEHSTQTLKPTFPK